MFVLLAAALPLLVCEPAPQAPSSGSCLTMVAGLDTTCANDGGDFIHLGGSSAQTFMALSKKIRRITLWRVANQAVVDAGLGVYILGTTPWGAPDIGNVIYHTTASALPQGDGIHPVRMDVVFDPPVLLPSYGQYCLAFQILPCGSYMTFLSDSLSLDSGYGGGSLWHFDRSFTCTLQPYTAYPGADLIFEVEFCATTVCAEADMGQIASLQCPDGFVVSAIDVASYGNPTGTCGFITPGSCDSPQARGVVEDACLGQPNCDVLADPLVFGDPCPGLPKRLAIQAAIHAVGPDLTLSRLDVPPRGGSPLAVSYTVLNRTDFAAGPFRTTLRISADSTIDDQDPVVWSRTEPGLGPRDSIVVAAVMPLPAEPRGDVYLGAFVDDADQVDEELESNNQRVVAFGYESPHILSVTDVPNDQGGKVAVQILPSPEDQPGVPSSIVSYDVFRENTGGNWGFAGSTLAHGLGQYTIEASTPMDSTPGVGSSRARFLVQATTSDPVIFYGSAYDSGYSVDNIAPAQPTRFQGKYLPSEVALQWARSPEPDLKEYHVYKLQAPDYQPSPARQIAALTDTMYSDSMGSVFNTYGLSAVDIHGNEGPPARVSFTEPLTFALLGVTPNPSQNGPVTVAFMLQTSRPVHLEVVDIAGRRIVQQEVGHLGPGLHAVAMGQGIHPGLYFVRLVRDDASGAHDARTKKFVVLR